MASLHSLAPELFCMVFQHLSRRDVKQLRLVNKFLSRIATPICFKRIRFALEDGQFNHLVQIAFHEELCHFVQELELSRSPGLAPVSLNTFKDLTTLTPSSASDIGDDDDHPDGHPDDDHPDENHTIFDEVAYAEYKAECIRLREQAYSAVKYISFHRTGCERWIKRVHPDTLRQPLLDRFDEAILRLRNLKSFIHVPGFKKEDLTSRWPDLTLNVMERYLRFDKQIKALQLSYVLRALGSANYFNHNLQSIEIYVGTTGFWSVQDLKNL
ncbi:hypothetical protein K469DRAFT_681881 [Zopfia rhizophila CBS 207.26]|uniref:F-box domain-containing protein n=1 Tax=Zopfia rhizophila CBS 207.26 TaxID=1314779 RepID=A0A6A6EXR1_9PEZI|nr:hypothetical protein K469DRAFT_681881 [Zopfia rhizophila CBS 207.26]